MVKRFTFVFLAYMVLSLRQMWRNLKYSRPAAHPRFAHLPEGDSNAAPGPIPSARETLLSRSSMKLRRDSSAICLEIANLSQQHGLPGHEHLGQPRQKLPGMNRPSVKLQAGRILCSL
jgi:hypothetical protein